MKTLYDAARVAERFEGSAEIPRTNVDGLAKLMVLVAREVARVNLTGQAFEDIERDAVLVMRVMIDGLMKL